jgi:chitinase
MKRDLFILCIGLLIGTVGIVPSLLAKESSHDIIAYLFVRDRLIQPEEIAAEKLTRINYAFANIKEGVIVEGFQNDRENYRTLNSLKQRNPRLKILVSVGGWTWSGGFSDMALTRESRHKFIESAVQFVRIHQLDGVDIDWEYPGLPGYGNPNRPEDKQNFTALLKELRARLDQEGKKLGRHLFTSVATGASESFLEHTEMAKVQRYLDTVNLMTYDFYEAGSDPTTGHHACLYTNPADPKKVSADSSVKSYIQAGVSPKKIVLGVPFYGRAWAEVEPANNGLFQVGKEAKIHASYNEIAEGYLNKNGFIRYWDSKASAPYLWNETIRTWISFDDVESMKLKCQYVRQRKLRGIMFWEYSGDHSQDLLRAINEGLRGK